MTQAVAEYQDFITFFPFLDEAAYAQMQIGMAYYRRMEKPTATATKLWRRRRHSRRILKNIPRAN